MTVVEHVSSDEKLLMTAMALCSDAELENGEAVGEATECALVNDANKNGLDKTQLKERLPRVDEAPFDSVRKRMSTIHKAEKEDIPAALLENAGAGNGFLQFTKGAPDEVLNCSTKILKDGKIIPLTEELRSEILSVYKGMADRALRVLGAAVKLLDQIPSTADPVELEQDLIWIGMCGMIDPIRPEVKAAIEQCRSAGIRPVMITGDHKDTAVAIAKELGILGEGQKAVTGAELDAIPDEEFAQDVRKYSVYARVQPENKVRIVDAWQALGRITAMTGDGVNDAPAIKSADIGVGMGITGTDVTKSVADMILTDDNFATIVSAVAEGRRIYDNIRKAIQFLLSANLAEVLAVFISTLLGFTIFRPVHILWINLITDTFPAISLGMEEAEKDTMNRPPRSPKESIFAGGLGFDVILEGCVIAALTIVSYFAGHRIESGVWGIGQSSVGMTMAFLTLSMMEIFHSFNLRSRRQSLFALPKQNKWLWGTLAFSTAMTAAVVFIPALRTVFSFAPVSLKDYGIALLIAICIIPIMEIIKFFSRLSSK
jgi:Ca2+-transporting ATPase